MSKVFAEKKKRFRFSKDNIEFSIMALPVFIYILIFAYIPMIGVILAFKNFRIDLGFLDSPWVGFENFTFFFQSQDAMRVTRNTIFLNLLFMAAGTAFSVLLALFLFDITKRSIVKVYQTIIILPNFLSWVIVAFMIFLFLNPQYGVINQVLNTLGIEGIQWYGEAGFWPVILVLVSMWKGCGLGAVVYYAALMGVSSEYYEAAEIDGASRWQMRRYISIPFLTPIIIMFVILGIGAIFRSDFGMFYQVTRDSGALYETVDVIDTYVYRALKTTGDIGMGAAVGLYQSVVGFVLVVITNYIIRRIDSENAMF